MTTFKQVHNSLTAVIAELNNLQTIVNAFYRLVEKLVDENHATNTIHKDLMVVVRSASEFMSQTPTLLNTIIDMLTSEKADSKATTIALEKMQIKVDETHAIVFALVKNMVGEEVYKKL